jgi:hypothetical protein
MTTGIGQSATADIFRGRWLQIVVRLDSLCSIDFVSDQDIIYRRRPCVMLHHLEVTSF